MIRGVLFDAGGTLLRVDPSVGSIYSDEASRFGVLVPSDVVNQSFRAAWKQLRPAPDNATPFHTSEAVERQWWRTLVESTFKFAGALRSFNGTFDAFFDSLYLRFEQPDVWKLFDDVIPALDALDNAGVPYAIVSNWDSRLPRLLDRMGLASRFQFILTSAEAGVSKPATAIFEVAVDRFGYSRSEVLHVGDSVEEDVVGAKNAGIRSVHLSRIGISETAPSIASLEDISRFLNN